MILLNRNVLPIRLVHDRKRNMQIIIDMRNWKEKVSRVGKSMAAKWAQVWQLPRRPPNFSDVSPGSLRPFRKIDTESHTSLHHKDLPRLKEQFPEFSLDIQISFLGTKQEIPIVVAESSLVHVRIDHVNIQRDSFFDIRVTASAESMQAINEVNCFVVGWEWEGRPFGLFWQCLDLWVA
jgi:hypothetical protein